MTMKKSHALILSLFIIIASCKKNNDDKFTGISANINGKAWQAKYITAFEGAPFIDIDMVGLYAVPGDTTQLEIVVPDSIQVNKPNPFQSTTVRYYLNDSTTYDGLTTYGHGMVTVTSLDTTDHKVAGIFNGVLYNIADDNDSVSVTNGRFNISYSRF